MTHQRIFILLATLLALSTTGCAGFGQKLKSFLAGQSDAGEREKTGPTFSEQAYQSPGPRRKYERVTKQSFENSAQLEPNAGSLWVNEGQGAYLFSQNIMRMMGDPLAVKVEGEPKQQLISKVETIKKLMDKLDARRGGLRGSSEEEAKPEAPAEAPGTPAAPGKGAGKTQASTELSVKMVPTRIIERLLDGNYRIKGSQPMMIGNREYKVIVTGIVRAEDFSDEGISATQLIDPKFDIVSPRRKEIE